MIFTGGRDDRVVLNPYGKPDGGELGGRTTRRGGNERGGSRYGKSGSGGSRYGKSGRGGSRGKANRAGNENPLQRVVRADLAQGTPAGDQAAFRAAAAENQIRAADNDARRNYMQQRAMAEAARAGRGSGGGNRERGMDAARREFDIKRAQLGNEFALQRARAEQMRNRDTGGRTAGPGGRIVLSGSRPDAEREMARERAEREGGARMRAFLKARKRKAGG